MYVKLKNSKNLRVLTYINMLKNISKMRIVNFKIEHVNILC